MPAGRNGSGRRARRRPPTSLELRRGRAAALPAEADKAPARSRRSSPETQASEDGCATQILGTLARRAYRRPIADQDLQKLLGFYRQGRAQDGFDAGIQSALERLLVDPEFLFRVEREPAVAAPGRRIARQRRGARVAAVVLPVEQHSGRRAARCWRRAASCTTRAVLEQQVRRMLADPRASALVSNFAAQWLYLRNVRGSRSGCELVPGFDDNLRDAFREETELFVDSQLREDRSVVELLTANYTFLNERLARHYGIPDVYGSHFRRVTLADESRGGLLGQGSILMVTSYATRTSPVLRGKWLLENILGAPPPPPPPERAAAARERGDGRPGDVGARAAWSSTARIRSARAATRRWIRSASRSRTSTRSASGAPADETNARSMRPARCRTARTFDGPAELRELLLAQREDFVTTVAEKLLTYALGRGLEYYDMPAVRRDRARRGARATTAGRR